MAIGFRAVSAPGTISANGQSLQVTIPATVQPGDGMILVSDISATATHFPLTALGWAQRAGFTTLDGTNTFRVFSKVATIDDPGSQVTLVSSSTVPRGAARLAAWSGTDPGDPIAEIFPKSYTANDDEHTLDPIVTDVADCWLVEVIGSKSPDGNPITSYTRGGTFTVRGAAYSSSVAGQSGREVAIGDDGTAHPISTSIGGEAPWVSDVATNNFGGATIALRPASGVQTVHLVSDIDQGGFTATPALASGATMASRLSDGLDSTYIQTSAAPTGEVYEGRLGLILNPGAGEDLTLRIRVQDSATSSVSREWELFQGVTVIASGTDTTVHADPTWLTFTIDAVDVATIDFDEPVDYRYTLTAS
jgi:hypothetical protein